MRLFVTVFVLTTALLSFSLAAFATAPLVQNGGFEDGMTAWTVATPLLGMSLVYDDGLGNHSLCLQPSGPSYYGPVVNQNMNLTDVAGKYFTVSFDVQMMYGWSYGDLNLVLSYVDNSNQLHRITALSSNGKDIASTGWTTITDNCLVPCDARKIVGLALETTPYTNLYVDNVSLSASGVTIGSVAEATGISPDHGDYGTTVTITGTGFGSASPTNEVLIGNSKDGITILSWTDTEVQARVDDPAVKGRVDVVSDFVRANGDLSFKVTSPYYGLSIMQGSQKVVKGQIAQYLVRVDTSNGFTSPSGIGFSVPDAPAGVVSFAPASVHGKGGTLMSVDTSTLDVGTYSWTLRADDSSALPRSAAMTLEVTSTASIVWTSTEDWTTITDITTTKQGQLSIESDATQVGGDYIDPHILAIVSSDPSKLLVYHSPNGYYSFYAYENGTASLTATAPDGASATLTVHINFPTETSIPSAGCSPSVISNNGTDVVEFTALSQIPSLNASWFDGNISVLDMDWGSDLMHFTSHATAIEGSDPGTFLFEASNADGTAYRPALFTVANDSSRGQINGQVFILETGERQQAEMSGNVEFYDSEGSLLFSRHIWAYGLSKAFSLPYVAPGTYRLRFVPGGGSSSSQRNDQSSLGGKYSPQWYSNAGDLESATEVTVVAGETINNVYFFLQAAPLEITQTDPKDRAVCVPCDSPISAEFNRQLAWNTVSDSTFFLTDSQGNTVPGFTSCDGMTISFEAASPLEAGKTYTATITTGVKDYNGMTLEDRYGWSFTTGNNLICDLKSLEDGHKVAVESKNLYYVDASGYIGYVEEPNRSSGIRVQGLYGATQDMTITLHGEMSTTEYGERFIMIDDMSQSDIAETKPLGANNQALTMPLMNGLKVRAWGVAHQVTEDSYMISDGATSNGIKVYGRCPVNEGESTTVTGAAGREAERVIYALQDAPDAPPATAGTNLTINWDPSQYSHGQEVYELQVIRDGGINPVRAIRDPSVWDLGRTDLSNLYNTSTGTDVVFSQITSMDSPPNSMSWTVPAESYGITHTYQLRAILRQQVGVDEFGGPVFNYSATDLGNAIIGTAIEPVHVVTPSNGEPVLVSDLRAGSVNLTAGSSAGADQYRMTVEPVIAGSAPTWTSNVIYWASGGIVSLPDGDRLALAAQLSNPECAGQDMKWRVDARQSADTNTAWTQGDTAVFSIGNTPPPPP